ncbi:hypothetical protein B0H11DRAFT_1931113 [Mycena galericulata]|nr:hypothetical protein B0H11DRAFT_1931113 [Mycena galericulata]
MCLHVGVAHILLGRKKWNQVQQQRRTYLQRRRAASSSAAAGRVTPWGHAGTGAGLEPHKDLWSSYCALSLRTEARRGRRRGWDLLERNLLGVGAEGKVTEPPGDVKKRSRGRHEQTAKGSGKAGGVGGMWWEEREMCQHPSNYQQFINAHRPATCSVASRQLRLVDVSYTGRKQEISYSTVGLPGCREMLCALDYFIYWGVGGSCSVLAPDSRTAGCIPT